MADDARQCLADGKIQAAGGASRDLEGDARRRRLRPDIAAPQLHARYRQDKSGQGEKSGDTLGHARMVNPLLRQE